MSEDKTGDGRTPDAEIEIILHGDGPFPAAQVGALLSALAADYRRLNRGRDLIIVEVGRGSLTTILTDQATWAAAGGAAVGAAIAAKPYLDKATEVAKGVQAVRRFTKAVLGLFKSAEATPGEALGPGPKQPGQRSVEALLEAAVNLGHEVEYKTDGDKAELRISPLKAVRIREQARVEIAARRAQAALEGPPPYAALTGPTGPQPNAEDLAALAEDRDRLKAAMLRLSGPTDSSVTGSDELAAFVTAVVSTLRGAAALRLLEMLISDLDQGGHPQLAEMVRSALRSSPPGPAAT